MILYWSFKRKLCDFCYLNSNELATAIAKGTYAREVLRFENES